MKRTGVGVVSLLTSLAIVATAAAKPITLELKLPEKPEFIPPEMVPALAQGPVALTVVDARGAEGDIVVGAQREKGKDVYQWKVSEPVAPAVAGFVRQLLDGWSVPQAPDAELGMKLELMRYYVNERSEMFGSSYNAEVRFKTSLVDKTGRVLWSGESNGEAKRSGVDGRASSCNEVLSIALRGALASALSSAKPPIASPPEPAPQAPVAAPAPAAAPVVIEPDALFADLTRLRAGGVADDVLVAYVEQRKLSRPLTVDEILRWKNAGLPDTAIKAASK